MKQICREPVEVIKKDEFSNYESQIESLWSRIVNLNCSFIILKKISTFPFHFFYPSNPPFWHFTRIALFQRLILLTWNIIVDENFDEGLTIKQVKNNIMGKYIKDEYKNILAESLKENKHEDRISAYENQIRNIRHNFVAHYNYRKTWENRAISAQDKIDLSELEKCINEVNDYFKLLCFSHEYMVYPMEYGKPNKTDIEKLLDNIVMEDPSYKMKENNPDRWERRKNRINVHKLELINKYRIENGLEPVL